jgi:Acetyltransferase (GNAT) domain
MKDGVLLMSGFSRLKTISKEYLKSRDAASQGLETWFFDDWHPELDQALQSLPEADIFPHELFRMLMKMSNSKKIILVTERGEPVAVAGLRNRWGYWEPVTQWIVPGILFPVKDGYLSRVLPALALEIKIAWWRWEEPPPQKRWIRNAQSTPTHGMSITEDYEKYWKSNGHFKGHFKDIRLYRNRCRDFELRCNSPGGVEWTIRNWEAKWRPQGIAEMPDLAERVLVGQFLQKNNLYHSLLLFDGEVPAAGLTMMIHRNEAVAHCNCRDPNYDWNGVSTHLLDLAFRWVKDAGYSGIDLGGSFEYKEKWAPERGEKWKFDVCPDHIALKMRISELAFRARKIVNRS